MYKRTILEPVDKNTKSLENLVIHYSDLKAYMIQLVAKEFI